MNKKQDVAVKEATDMATITELLKAQALAQQEVSESSGGSTMKASHSGFSIPGIGDIEAPLQVVILGFVSTKVYYNTPYIEGKFRIPACAALGTGTFETLIPAKESPTPVNDTCLGCEFNEFGTATNGRGKMCGDYKILAFMLPDAKAKDPIYLARISPSGLPEFNAYTNRLNKRYQLPAVAFISELGIKAAGQSIAITVKELAPLEDATLLSNFMGRQEEAMKMLLEPIRFTA